MPKIGRPRTTEPLPETSEAASPKLPAPPGKHLSPEQFTDYWVSIPEVSRPRLLAYLYRLWPVIVRQQADPTNRNYIDKYAEPVSGNELLNMWGAGVYELRLTDKDRKKFGEIAVTRIDLKDKFPDYPPTVDPRELDMDAPENRAYISWAQAKGFLKMNATSGGQPDAATAALADVTRTLLRAAQERPPQNTAEAQAFPKLLDMFREANKASLDMVISQMRSNDPEQFLKLLSVVKELMGGNNSANSSEKLLETVIKMQTDHSRAMAELQNKNTDLLMKLIETKNGGSGLGQLKEMAEAFMGMRELFGGEGSSRPTKWWEALLEQGLPMIPQTFREIGSMVKAISYASAMSRAAKTGEAPPPPPPESPAEITAGPPAASNPAPGAPGMVQQQLAQFGGMIVNALNQGIPGDEFAGNIVSMVDLNGGKGMLVYMQIRTLGKEGILQALQSHAGLWQQLQPLGPALDQFIDEFLAYGDEDETPEEEPPGPVPIERTHKRKPQ